MKPYSAYAIAEERNKEHSLNPLTQSHPGYHYMPAGWFKWYHFLSPGPGDSPTYVREG